MNHYQRFFAALHGQPVDQVPLFPLLMYLPADRASISYREYATNGVQMAEAQLLVQDRYGLDSITTNDIPLFVYNQRPVAITIGRDQGIGLVFVHPGGEPFRLCHGFRIDRHKAVRPAQIDDISAQGL